MDTLTLLFIIHLILLIVIIVLISILLKLVKSMLNLANSCRSRIYSEGTAVASGEPDVTPKKTNGGETHLKKDQEFFWVQTI